MTTNTEKTAVAEKPGEKRRALGRGLESLLPSGPRVVPSTPVPGSVVEIQAVAQPRTADTTGNEIIDVPLDHVEHNPYQTRTQFSDNALQELADSIEANGVLQPIVVRPGKENGQYILILGERRCRASKLAGKEKIPAIVRRVSDQQAAEMTIVENLQRQDLNCLDQAMAFARLSRDFGLTQEQIGLRTGVSRESVANYMRILKLPPRVLEYLREGMLGFSEARVLLQLAHPPSIPSVADFAVKQKLSVAQLRDYVEQMNLPEVARQGPPPPPDIDPNVKAAQSELERILGVRVKINDRKGKGRIVIEYSSLDDFDRVIEMLSGKGN